MAWNQDGFRDYLDGSGDSEADPSAERPIETIIGIPLSRASEGRRRGPGQSTLSPASSPEKNGALSLSRSLSLSEEKKEKQPALSVYIDDSDNFHDERIKPQQLRRFLQARPDMAQLLWECIVQEGLDQLEDDDDV